MATHLELASDDAIGEYVAEALVKKFTRKQCSLPEKNEIQKRERHTCFSSRILKQESTGACSIQKATCNSKLAREKSLKRMKEVQRTEIMYKKS